MQYTQIFAAIKSWNIPLDFLSILLIIIQNIDCEYTLEPPRWGGSNEYPQSMFCINNKKSRFTPVLV